ncbi:MAG: hypothetical protein R6X22_13390 [Gemmatimonadota bacterium]
MSVTESRTPSVEAVMLAVPGAAARTVAQSGPLPAISAIPGREPSRQDHVGRPDDGQVGLEGRRARMAAPPPVQGRVPPPGSARATGAAIGGGSATSARPAGARAALGMDHMGINWEPHGHPPSVFLTPHFDFHFYNIATDDVDAIDCSDASKPATLRAEYDASRDLYSLVFSGFDAL